MLILLTLNRKKNLKDFHPISNLFTKRIKNIEFQNKYRTFGLPKPILRINEQQFTILSG